MTIIFKTKFLQQFIRKKNVYTYLSINVFDIFDLKRIKTNLP